MSYNQELLEYIKFDTFFVKFDNGENELMLRLTNNEEAKQWPLNTASSEIRDRCTDVYHVDRWNDFINQSSGSFRFKFRRLFIKDQKLIVINDISEVQYYGYEIAFFDLDDIREKTKKILSLLCSFDNIRCITANEYIMTLRGGNIVVYFNNKQETIIPNVKHFGTTHYGYPNEWTNSKDMSEIVEQLREGKTPLRFRTGGVDLYTIEMKNEKYYFIDRGIIRYVFEDSESLQTTFDSLTTMKW